MTEQTYVPEENHVDDVPAPVTPPQAPFMPPAEQPAHAYQPEAPPYVPYAPPHPPAPPVKEKKARTGVPGTAGFGFTASLLALSFVHYAREPLFLYLNLFKNFGLNGVYPNESEFSLYYYLTIAWGAAIALFALLGLVFSAVGCRVSRKQGREGAAIGVAGILIAIVAILVSAAVTVSYIVQLALY